MTYDIMTNDVRTFDLMTFEVMTYDVMTYDIMTYDVITNEGMAYNVMTYDVITYDIKTCARKPKRQHFHAKTTRANLYMYIRVGQGPCKKSKPSTARAYTTLVALVYLAKQLYESLCPYFGLFSLYNLLT